MVLFTRDSLAANGQNYNLLLQFILSEIVALSKEVQPLLTYLSDPEKHSIQNTQDCLMHLVGDERSKLISSWHESPLSKLKTYCGHLNRTEEKNSFEEDLLQEVNQMSVLAIQTLDFISLQKSSSELIAYLKKIAKSFQRILKQSAKILMHTAYDENLLFFLLRHFKEMQLIYGLPFFNQFLRRNFPEGKSALKSYLEQRFVKRNFIHIIPIIDTHLNELYAAHSFA